MEIAVISKKGGVGKTPFAFSLAKDLQYYLISNDNSIIEKIYPKKAKIMLQVMRISDNTIYDFGGFVDAGVLEIIKGCKYVIVPCTPTFNAVLRAAETIREIEPINKNIIILATNYINDKELETLENFLKNAGLDRFKTFKFKTSKILNNAMSTGLSFRELYKETGLSRSNYQTFYEEYRQLLQYLIK